jgi:hypothetical protein
MISCSMSILSSKNNWNLFLLKFYLSKKWFVVNKTLYICNMILIKILPKTELLLQINAIKLNPGNPFTWAWWKSPIYCDNRLILSFPPIRNYVRDDFLNTLRTNLENQMLLPVLRLERDIPCCWKFEYPLYMFAQKLKHGPKPSRGVLAKGTK